MENGIDPLPVTDSDGYHYTCRCGQEILFVQRGHWMGCLFERQGFDQWRYLRPADKEDLYLIANRIALGN